MDEEYEVCCERSLVNEIWRNMLDCIVIMLLLEKKEVICVVWVVR